LDDWGDGDDSVDIGDYQIRSPQPYLKNEEEGGEGGAGDVSQYFDTNDIYSQEASFEMYRYFIKAMFTLMETNMDIEMDLLRYVDILYACMIVCVY
jgi:hypothetical protein